MYGSIADEQVAPDMDAQRHSGKHRLGKGWETQRKLSAAMPLDGALMLTNRKASTVFATKSLPDDHVMTCE